MIQRMKLLIHFPRNTALEPVTYTLVKEYDVKINIIKAMVTNSAEGFLLIEATAEKESLKQAVKYLKEQGLKVEKNATGIYVDLQNCVHCGACIAACNVGALEMDETHHLLMHREKCIECALCVRCCPGRHIRDVFRVETH